MGYEDDECREEDSEDSGEMDSVDDAARVHDMMISEQTQPEE